MTTDMSSAAMPEHEPEPPVALTGFADHPMFHALAEEILNLIEEDEDIITLILAANSGEGGPGPLVASLHKTIGQYPVPVGIVPGNLTDDELDALS